MKLFLISVFAAAAVLWVRWELKHPTTSEGGSWVDEVQRYLDEVGSP